MIVDEWLGPVYEFDRRLSARSYWVYLFRVFFLGTLLLGLWMTSVESARWRGIEAKSQLARSGAAFFKTILGIGFVAAGLIGPAATAASICTERSRGNYDLCLASGIGPNRIVWGKFLARLWPVLGTIAAAVPVLSLSSLLGGVDPTDLFESFFVCCAMAAMTCGVTVLVSFRSNKAHEALLVAYLWLAIGLLAVPFLQILLVESLRLLPPIWYRIPLELNPLWAVFVSKEGGGPRFGRSYFSSPTQNRMASIAVMLLIGSACVAWTSARLRTYLLPRKSAAETRSRRRSRERSRDEERLLDESPVEWREIRRQTDSEGMKWVWRGYGILCLLATSLVILIGAFDRSMPMDSFAGAMTWIQLILGVIILATIAPTSMSDERAQGSLDVLAATPLSSAEIIAGKWKGNRRWLKRLTILPIIAYVSGVILHRDSPPTVVFGRAPIRSVPPPRPAIASLPTSGRFDSAISVGAAAGFPRRVESRSVPFRNRADGARSEVGFAQIPFPRLEEEIFPFAVGAAAGLIDQTEMSTMGLAWLGDGAGTKILLSRPTLAELRARAARGPLRTRSGPVRMQFHHVWMPLLGSLLFYRYVRSLGLIVTSLGLILAVVVKWPSRASAGCLGFVLLLSVLSILPSWEFRGIGQESTFRLYSTTLGPLTFTTNLIERTRTWQPTEIVVNKLLIPVVVFEFVAWVVSYALLSLAAARLREKPDGPDLSTEKSSPPASVAT